MSVVKTAIIGAGPAGYTAAIYAARANLEPILFEGMEPGGQLTITTEVENFPGFPEGIMGPVLMENIRAQVERFGTKIISDVITDVDFSQKPFVLKTAEEEYRAHSVIIATGASARWMGLESEARFRGRGISACATCDGAFFREKEVIVVGGGDTAMEEAMFLTKFAKKVYILHRRDTLRASKIMQERASANEKISFIWNTVITEFQGALKLDSVKLKNTKTGEESIMKIDGVFMGLGHDPNTGFLKSQIHIDENGFIVLPNPGTTHTNIPGVFAAGDVMDQRYRQAITAAGRGCAAALDSEKYLQEHNLA